MLGWELGFGRGMMQMPSSAAPGPACDSIPGQGRGGRNETPRRVVWKAKQGALRLCFRHHCPSSGAQSGPQLPGSFKTHTEQLPGRSSPHGWDRLQGPPALLGLGLVQRCAPLAQMPQVHSRDSTGPGGPRTQAPHYLPAIALHNCTFCHH